MGFVSGELRLLTLCAESSFRINKTNEFSFLLRFNCFLKEVNDFLYFRRMFSLDFFYELLG